MNNSKDFTGPPDGAVKNSVTGKTIREMSWDEIFRLASKPMTQAEATKQMQAVRKPKNNGQSS